MISKQLRQFIEKYKVIQTRGSDKEIKETEELILQFCEGSWSRNSFWGVCIMNLEDTLFKNLYEQYRNQDLPKDILDLPAFRKANEAFTEILGDEDEL